MFEMADKDPDRSVEESEYGRLLGYPPGHELGGRARELADKTREWYGRHGKPWIYLRQAGTLQISGNRILVDGTALASKHLLHRLLEAGATTAILAAVSAGRECEEYARQLWNEEKPDEYFFMEVYGSAVVEHLIARAAYHLCEWADGQGKAVLPHYSPGYPGWDITDQIGLLRCIQDGNASGLPMSVLETGMLFPKKSLLAVFGLTPHVERVRRLAELIPCENCSLRGCGFRRAPYRRVLPQTEDIGRLQKRMNSTE